MTVVFNSFDVFELSILPFDKGFPVLKFLGVRYFYCFNLYCVEQALLLYQYVNLNIQLMTDAVELF